MKACNDPDAPALDAYAEGVRIGHRLRMPRTPAVYEEKSRWRLNYDEEDNEVDWASNYKTARERREVLEEKVEADVALGRMKKMTMREARERYGERLMIGAIGLVEEGGNKFRLIHDGTKNVKVNLRIRCRDHIPGPLVNDIAAEMAEVEESRMPHLALVWDFESAHRIVQVAEADWGLQACTTSFCQTDRLPEDALVYLNTVGTFGVSTAGHWWGRLAGMLGRCAHYLLGPELASWILIFADDGKVLMPVDRFKSIAPVLLAFYACIGFSIKWQKIRGGIEFQWVGYWSDLKHHRVGISEKRRQWVIEWIRRVCAGEDVETDFDSGLGRLSFVCGAILFDRPFLAPLYSWSATTRRHHGGKANIKRLPPYIKFILWFLGERLKSRRTISCLRGRPRPQKAVERFRTDAKAEGDLITLGGFETHNAEGRELPHSCARWFFLKLDRTSAPWAFTKGEPFRTISSLEMLGTLIAIMLFIEDGCKEGERWTGSLSAGGLTDNRGNSFALNKLLSTKWPLMAFLAETAVQLEEKNIAFEVEWVPREQNAEADAITNGSYAWLNPDRRIPTSLDKLPFKVLHTLLHHGAQFYGNLENVNEEAAPEQRKDVRSLRVRDPWD